MQLFGQHLVGIDKEMGTTQQMAPMLRPRGIYEKNYMLSMEMSFFTPVSQGIPMLYSTFSFSGAWMASLTNLRNILSIDQREEHHQMQDFYPLALVYLFPHPALLNR